jgi:REP element-mobilizing transposase RayT
MPQSLAKIYIHLVFSTRNRARMLDRADAEDLHSYMGGILRGHECTAVEINTEPDHCHVLFLLHRTKSLSDVVGQLKSGSTNWLRVRHARYQDFHWQNGYGAFSVSSSNVPAVRRYILTQEEHHRVLSFQDEFRELLERHEIEFDERYVWD